MTPQPMTPMPTRFIFPRVQMNCRDCAAAPGQSCSRARRRARFRAAAAAAPRAQAVSSASSTAISETSASQRGSAWSSALRRLPSSVFAQHQRRPDENDARRREKRDRGWRWRGRAPRRRGAQPRSARCRRQRSARPQCCIAMAETDRLAELRLVAEAERGSPAPPPDPPAATWPSRRFRDDAMIRSPRLKLIPLAPRKSSPPCMTPSPSECSTVTTTKSSRSRQRRNQCSADGDGIGVALDERREAKALEQRLAEGHVGVAQDRDSRRTKPEAYSTTPGSATQRLSTASRARPASATQRRTPSSTRSAITSAGWRSTRTGCVSSASTSPWKSVTTCTMRIGVIFTPTTRAASGLSSSMHARPAARRVAHRAHLPRHDQSIVEQRRGDRGDGGGAELGPLGDFHARDRPKAADRIHHMEAIDRTHEFRIGRLHRSAAPRRRKPNYFSISANSLSRRQPRTSSRAAAVPASIPHELGLTRLVSDGLFIPQSQKKPPARRLREADASCREDHMKSFCTASV